MRPEPPLVFHPSSFGDLPLDLLIDRIDGGLGDDEAFLVTIRADRRAVQFGFRPLDEHPVDAVLGFVVPDEIDAFGVAVTGTARSIDPAGDDGDGPTGRVRIVQIHARDGRTASRIRRIGADPPEVLETRTAEGDVADCLRRALGLPTAPPPHPPLVWWAVDWLDAVLDHVCRDPRRRWSWAAISRLHPLSGPLPPDSPSALVARVREAAEGLDWSALRLAAATDLPPGSGPRHPVAPEVAAWMDDGMFARWLLGSRPDPVDVVVDLVDLLPPAVTRGVVEALQAWGCW
jgi:hypothetical protein